MNTNLTRKEESVNAVRAILKGIPYLGETLDQFIFGRLDELRFKRFESTLTEIAAMLKESKRDPRVDSEQFVELLEAITPSLVRATRNEKRERFRDLLLNAATLPPDSAEWEKAKLAGQLLAELEAPALAVLASVAHYIGAQPASIVSLPRPQVVNQESFSWDSPSPGLLVIDFDWSVVEEWMRRLREKRLIGFQSHDARGGFGGVYLTELGKMLVEWTVGERSTT
jgi:hypothetical protein